VDELLALTEDTLRILNGEEVVREYVSTGCNR